MYAHKYARLTWHNQLDIEKRWDAGETPRSIASAVGVSPACIYKWLRPPVIRDEKGTPGEMIHIDLKKLGRIEGIGHRMTGDRTGQSNGRNRRWEYLHLAIDDPSRLAYSEIFPDEKRKSAIQFPSRMRCDSSAVTASRSTAA